MALAQNPTMAQSQANVRVAEGQARQASRYPNPTAGYYGDEIRGGYSNGGKQGGFVSQTIITGGKLQAARRTAEFLTREAVTIGEAQQLRVLTDVRLQFHQVLTNQQLVDLQQKSTQLAADMAETSRRLFNVGQADRPDVLQAEIEQQRSMLRLTLAKHELAASWRMLATVAGNPELPQEKIEGDWNAIPQLKYEDWLAKTLQTSPELKLAGQTVERAVSLLGQAKKAVVPDLQLQGTLSQNNEPLMETSPRITGLNGGVQIGVQLPLFNRNQGGIAAARAEAEGARQDLARIRLRTVREFAGTFREYESARDTAQQYRTEILPRAEEALHLYQSNFRKMAVAWPQALAAQRTLFESQTEYVRAVAAAWRAALSLQGFRLSDGLSIPAPPDEQNR